MTRRDIKRELEKQLQLLSKFSENKNIKIGDRLRIADRIVKISNVLAFFC